MRIRGHFCCVLGLAVGLAVMLAPGAMARGVVTKRYRSVHVGLLKPVRVARLARNVVPASPLSRTVRGARPIPRTAPSGVAAPLVAGAPQASAGRLAAGSSPLLANFNGVSSRDSEVTNFGQEFEPPDQGLCAGNGFVMEMVNSAYTIYTPTGKVVTGPFNVNGPFDEGLIEFTSDPRCEYDASTHTWYAAILEINDSFTATRVDLAVNTSGDPTTLWTNYQIDTTDIGGATGPKHPGCPCLGDQPLLGIDASNIYISTNEFSILGPEFNGAQIYAIAKSDLTTTGPPMTPAHFVHFDNLTIGGSVAASVQPALTTTGNPAAEYFLNSLDPNGTFDQRIGVWAMTNRGVVATGGKPTLSSIVTPSEAYGLPPGAVAQKGSSSLIDPGDDRMQQTQFFGGDVWGALDSAVTIPGDSAERAGAAWFDVRPSLSAGVIASAHVRRQGYVSLADNYLLYPAIQTTPSGKTVMVMSLSGERHFPSAAYSVLGSGATSFGPVTIAANGSTNYDPNAGRWGDYSWARLDPSGTSVWMATEYVPPKAKPDHRRAPGLGDPGHQHPDGLTIG